VREHLLELIMQRQFEREENERPEAVESRSDAAIPVAPSITAAAAVAPPAAAVAPPAAAVAPPVAAPPPRAPSVTKSLDDSLTGRRERTEERPHVGAASAVLGSAPHGLLRVAPGGRRLGENSTSSWKAYFAWSGPMAVALALLCANVEGIASVEMTLSAASTVLVIGVAISFLVVSSALLFRLSKLKLSHAAIALLCLVQGVAVSVVATEVRAAVQATNRTWTYPTPRDEAYQSMHEPAFWALVFLAGLVLFAMAERFRRSVKLV
jgi:hypothetical protein